MANGTKIEWTEATWNPITGCTVISQGCKNCYAMQLAGTRLKNHPSRAGLTRQNKDGHHVWTGEVRLNEGWLDQPLRWKTPRMIFVCAHGDLFHESVPDEWIDRVFAVMALCPQHTFQVLTKRAGRMRGYLKRFDEPHKHWPTMRNDDWDTAIVALWQVMEDNGYDHRSTASTWPLPNVWLGMSVEDQATANERIPLLLDTPAAVRWISAEPLLSEIVLNGWIGYQNTPQLDWVVAGGESGTNARPMHPDWARALRDQCAANGVPFFFKQWGGWLPIDQWSFDRSLKQTAIHVSGARIDDCTDEFPADGQRFACVGKTAAGRTLDGVLHDAMPEVAA
jgi:protein gp37